MKQSLADNAGVKIGNDVLQKVSLRTSSQNPKSTSPVRSSGTNSIIGNSLVPNDKAASSQVPKNNSPNCNSVVSPKIAGIEFVKTNSFTLNSIRKKPASYKIGCGKLSGIELAKENSFGIKSIMIVKPQPHVVKVFANPSVKNLVTYNKTPISFDVEHVTSEALHVLKVLSKPTVKNLTTVQKQIVSSKNV